MLRLWSVVALLYVYCFISPCENLRGLRKPGRPLRILCLLDDFSLGFKKKIIVSLSRATAPLTKRGFEAYVKTESIADVSPQGLLDLAARQLAHDSINTVFFYSTQSMNMATVEYVKKMVSSMGIPFMIWTSDNTFDIKGRADTQTLLLSTTIKDYCLAMLDLMRRYNWKQFSIVTSRIEGYEEFVDTLKKLSSEDNSDGYFTFLVDVTVEPESQPEKDIELELTRLKTVDTRVTLIYMNGDEAEKMFNVAQKLDMTGEEYVWISAQHSIEKLLTASLAKFQAPRSYPMGMLGFFDLDVAQINQFYSGMVIASNVERAFKVWTRGIEDMLDEIQKKNSTLANMSVAPETPDVFWKGGPVLFDFLKSAKLSEEGKEYSMFNEDGTSGSSKLTIYNVRGDHKIKQIGYWQRPKGITLQDITWSGGRVSPPSGKPSRYFLKVVTLKEEPYVIYSDPDPSTGTCQHTSQICRIAPASKVAMYGNDTRDPKLYQCCSGFCIDLLDELSKRISFDYELFQVEDGIWGIMDEHTKEWNGLVRAIQDEKADFAMTSLKITPERSQAVNFSYSFLDTGITILVGVRDGVVSPTAFLKPFDIMSWVFILLVCIHVMAMTLFCFEWMSPLGYDMQRLPPADHRFSLFRSFWMIWAMLLKAPVSVNPPRGVSSRFQACIWALFAVVFTASYTANLAAFMITNEDYDKLEGVNDWRLRNPELHKPEYKFGTIPNGSTESNLRRFHPEMFDYMKQYNQSGVDEAIENVKHSEINAFLYDATVLEYKAAQDDQCKLRTVGSWFARTGYGIAFPPGSKWLDVFNRELVRLQHQGALERLQRYWLAGACKKANKESEKSLKLGILNFTSAFILLVGGILLAITLLLLEHIYFKFLRGRLRKWDKCGCCGLISLSMGKSLTLKESVQEVVGLHKQKCQNPTCETHAWKKQHQLDLALMKIEQLRRMLCIRYGAGGTEQPQTERSYRQPTKVSVYPIEPYSEDDLRRPQERKTIGNGTGGFSSEGRKAFDSPYAVPRKLRTPGSESTERTVHGDVADELQERETVL